MKTTLVIDEGEIYTKIAKIVDDKISSLYLIDNSQEERQNKIYIGQITEIVKSLKSTFVDYGVSKKGLLPLKLIPNCYMQNLKLGLTLPVQVAKEQTGDKGDRLSGFINIKGYYFICLPYEKGISISKKIENKQDRQILKNLIETLIHDLNGSNYGFIVRTEAFETDSTNLKRELTNLIEQAKNFMDTKDFFTKGTKLLQNEVMYNDWLLQQKFPSDKLSIVTNSIVNNKLKKYILKHTPNLVIEEKLYPQSQSTFKLLNIEREFLECVKNKIWLKNGGNIVIEQTEAMTIVDVNTAKAVLTKDREKNILKLNQLAIEETMYQIVKRNLSGIIIIDLVEVDTQELKDLLFTFAKDCLNKFRMNNTQVYPVTELGLLQISKQRINKSLPEIIE
ncbi:hypothetical protein AN640_03540 [Candidatus Epulonipiscium fishelsonii]|uniref:Uncharacterized protein n=1 Tax=Candidatus Epulonipiscium fishelsonii TaxID=77094 RepID=A0ACC8XJ08_9FIRM|nr:hypothetical protein AN640_03540 [Epulopiscium sp. SCG-D08WGA-EpuloA1]OON97513.1 MAG: hypothetical protein ATN32_05445 [Epulopiscium sp. AS2M-Bin002]